MEVKKEQEKKECIKVSDVSVKLIDTNRGGLVGWASCVINDAIYLDNIAIRHDRDGEFILSFPVKKSTGRIRYFYFNPISREASAALNAAIIGKLKLLGKERVK